jgi:hypothetical protein
MVWRSGPYENDLNQGHKNAQARFRRQDVSQLGTSPGDGMSGTPCPLVITIDEKTLPQIETNLCRIDEPVGHEMFYLWDDARLGFDS